MTLKKETRKQGTSNICSSPSNATNPNAQSKIGTPQNPQPPATTQNFDVLLKTLTPEEQKVFNVLVVHEGKYLQKYFVKESGLSRLIEPLKQVMSNYVDVVVVVAGREGALASVVSGLVDVPVIAVPASNSYGFGEKGVSALIAVLQSCSLGLAVVNIDSGVAAGAVATLTANRAAKFRS